MRSWKMKLHIPKTKRYKNNSEYLELLKLVAAEQERQEQSKKGDNDNEL